MVEHACVEYVHNQESTSLTNPEASIMVMYDTKAQARGKWVETKKTTNMKYTGSLRWQSHTCCQKQRQDKTSNRNAAIRGSEAPYVAQAQEHHCALRLVHTLEWRDTT